MCDAGAERAPHSRGIEVGGGPIEIPARCAGMTEREREWQRGSGSDGVGHGAAVFLWALLAELFDLADGVLVLARFVFVALADVGGAG